MECLQKREYPHLQKRLFDAVPGFQLVCRVGCRKCFDESESRSGKSPGRSDLCAVPKAADQLDGIISKEFCADGIVFPAESGSGCAWHAFFYENHDILIMDRADCCNGYSFRKRIL